MPSEIQIIRAREFMRLGSHGRPHLERSRAALRHLASTFTKRGVDRALLDVRDVHRELTGTELAALVESFHDIGFAEDQRLAVLHTGDAEQRARLFALVGTLRGWSVQTFRAFEEAVFWLSSKHVGKTDSHAQSLPLAKPEGQKPRGDRRLPGR